LEKRAAARMRERRFAMMRAFMQIGRGLLFNVVRAFGIEGRRSGQGTTAFAPLVCRDVLNLSPRKWGTWQKGKGKATGGGGIRLRRQGHREAARAAWFTRLARAARRSALLRALGRAALAIAERQIRVAEARMMARMNPFRNWGGEPMRVYRQVKSAERRIVFFDRVARNFRNDLRQPRP
jgi:hypothetical protein